ncbi:MAG: hypothetical protein WCE26_11535 [Candidatus Acidiferrales bacterium]
MRISVLSAVKPKASFYHFLDRKFYRCLGGQRSDFEGICCKIVPKRSWTFVALAIVYLNASTDGSLPKERKPSVRLGYVSLSRLTYRDISTCLDGEPAPFDCDILYSKKNGTFDFVPASRIARWRTIEPKIIEAIAPYLDGSKLMEKLGHVLTEAQWTAVSQPKLVA